MSLLERFFSLVQEWISLLASSPFVAVGVALLLLVLIRRHGLLYYGSKLTSPVGFLCLGALLLPLFLSGGEGLGGVLLLQILMLFASELFLSSYARPSRHFAVFDIGFLVSLAALSHSGSLWVLLFYLIHLRGIGLLDLRHFGAIVLGSFSVLWLDFLLTLVPTLDGLQAWGLRHLRGLVGFTPPSLTLDAMLYGGFFVMLLAVSMFYYNFHVRALERHRFFLRIHLLLCWLSFGLQLLYSFDQVISLYTVMVLFYLGVMLQVFYASVRDKVWVLLMTALLVGLVILMSFVVLGGELWSYL